MKCTHTHAHALKFPMRNICVKSPIKPFVEVLEGLIDKDVVAFSCSHVIALCHLRMVPMEKNAE